MNILAQVLWRAAKFAGAHPRDPVIAEWMNAGATQAAARVTPESAMQITAVYACVRVISWAIASLPCIVYRYLGKDENGKDLGQERDPSHPLYQLLHDRPNRWQTPSDWLTYMLAGLLLRGNAYAEKIPTSKQAIAELIPLNPARTRPVLVDSSGNVLQEMQADAELVYWYTPLNGTSRVILASEMLHIRGMTKNGIEGLSPIAQHRETIGLALAQREYASRFFENDGRPGGAVQLKGTLKDEEAIKRFKASWAKAHSGANQHSVAILEEGSEWKDIGLSMVDAQFLELMKYGIADIAGRIYGVPLHMVGELDRSTNNNIEQQSIEFVRDTIRPYCVMIEQTYRRDLFDVADWQQTHTVEFLLDALMRGDTLSRYRAFSIGRQWGWLSANDVRRKEGENPVDGGDTYLSPANMQNADNPYTDQTPGGPQGQGGSKQT